MFGGEQVGREPDQPFHRLIDRNEELEAKIGALAAYLQTAAAGEAVLSTLAVCGHAPRDSSRRAGCSL
jgi:hypothetical protein